MNTYFLSKKIQKKIYNLTYKFDRFFLGGKNVAKAYEPKTILPNTRDKYSIAHVASFVTPGSNAGDILLPVVLRDLFVRESGGINWNTIHVHKPVNLSVIDSIKSTQGLIIGGGGLFLRDTNPNTISGWQWACSEAMLKLIDIPLCLFAVGYNRFRGQKEFDNVFRDNLALVASKSVFIGLRNTGSVNAVCKYLPDYLHEKVIFQPCMTTVIRRVYPDIFATNMVTNENGYIALNCAFDRINLRFSSEKNSIKQKIARAALHLANQTGQPLRYFFHCLEDLQMLDCLDSLNINYKVVDVSRLLPIEIIKLYQEPSIVIGMRGHSQMIPFGCGTPIISLISHDKMKWFLDDINQPDWGVDVSVDGEITEKIINIGNYILNSREKVIKAINSEQEKIWKITTYNVNHFIKHLN